VTPISSETDARIRLWALVYLEPEILAEIDRIGRSYDEPKNGVRFVLHCCSGSPCLACYGVARVKMGKIFTFVRRTLRSSDRAAVIAGKLYYRLPVGYRFSHQGVPRPPYPRGTSGPDLIPRRVLTNRQKASLCATTTPARNFWLLPGGPK